MWIITVWQRISQEVTVRSFKKCCISNAMVETDDMLCLMAVKRVETYNECEEDKALTVNMGIVTLIGKGR